MAAASKYILVPEAMYRGLLNASFFFFFKATTTTTTTTLKY